MRDEYSTPSQDLSIDSTLHDNHLGSLTCLALQMAWQPMFSFCCWPNPTLIVCLFIKHPTTPKQSLSSLMAFPLKIMFLLCNTCIWCKLLLGNHFSKLSPSEWTTTMGSNINNNKKRDDLYFTSMVPNSTSRRMHSTSLSLLVVNTSNGLQRLQFFLAFLSTFACWFHHPPVLTCCSF